MTPVGWLLGWFLPGCGVAGAAGLAPEQPVDFTRLDRRKPNQALVAGVGSALHPDLASPIFPVSAARLLQIIQDIATRRKRTVLAARFGDPPQLCFVARSFWCNFPDVIVAQAVPGGAERCHLLLYSRSVYGYADFGVNRRRVSAWVAAAEHAAKADAAKADAAREDAREAEGFRPA